MKPLKLCLAFLFAATLSACVAVPTQTFTASYGPEFKAYEGTGASSLTGQAFLRQQGGAVVVCAGEEVVLIPHAGFVGQAFDAAKSGIRPILAGAEGQRVSTAFVADPRFSALARRSRCDAQGNFSFEAVPAGKWIVSTSVRWVVGGNQQGSNLGAAVVLPPKSSATILLSDADRI